MTFLNYEKILSKDDEDLEINELKIYLFALVSIDSQLERLNENICESNALRRQLLSVLKEKEGYEDYFDAWMV